MLKIISALIFVQLKLTDGLSTDSSEDGETFGNIILYSTAGLIVLCVACLLIYRKRKLTIGGVTSLILFIQYTRWTAVLDSSTPSFYKAFWRQVNYLFDPVQVINTDGNSPDNQLMRNLGIHSTNFLENSEEYIGLWIFLAVLAFVAKMFKKELPFYIIAWGFLVSYFDTLIFCLLQIKDFSTDSLPSSIISVIVLIVFITFGIFTSLTILKGRPSEALFKIYIKEFKNLDLVVLRFYYPFFFISRLVLSFLYVFTETFTFQFIFLVGIETIFILHSLLFLPYKQNRNSGFSTFIHLLQLLCVLTPSLYGAFEEEMTSIILLVIISLGIASCVLRQILDISSKSTVTPSKELPDSLTVIKIPEGGEDSDVSVNEPKLEVINISHNDITIPDGLPKEPKTRGRRKQGKKKTAVRREPTPPRPVPEPSIKLPKSISRDASSYSKMAGAILGLSSK